MEMTMVTIPLDKEPARIYNEASQDELDRIIRKPKFNKYIYEDERIEFVSSLSQEAQRIKIVERISQSRDPKDDKFLELAASGKATCIVSGDEDLIVLSPFRGIPILT